MLKDATVLEENLLGILHIAREFSGVGGPSGQSLSQLLEELHYQLIRPQLNAQSLANLLRHRAKLIEDWLAYSEDKRTSLGWGFWAINSGSWAVGNLSGEFQEFKSRPNACAVFVLSELDYWSGIPNAV